MSGGKVETRTPMEIANKHRRRGRRRTRRDKAMSSRGTGNEGERHGGWRGKGKKICVSGRQQCNVGKLV